MAYRDGVPQNAEKAVEWFTKAAEQGDDEAQFQLGYLYSKGEGVVKNNAIAFYRYQQAEQGNVGAQYNLGLMYYNGDGLAKESTKAYELFIKAADNGDEYAQFVLGLMYKTGEGVTKVILRLLNILPKLCRKWVSQC